MPTDNPVIAGPNDLSAEFLTAVLGAGPVTAYFLGTAMPAPQRRAQYDELLHTYHRQRAGEVASCDR